jgi:hypothetical protein
MDRWIRYLEKPTEKYPYKNAWQAMLKKGGNPAEAKKLAEEFQANVVRVMIARRGAERRERGDRGEGAGGHQEKKRTEKPNFFVTNDDFCPGCGLQFKNLPDADNNFWIEVFQRELRDNEDPNAMMPGMRPPNPGVLMFRGWGLERRVGADVQIRLNALQEDLKELRRSWSPRCPFVHGVQDLEKPSNLKVSIRGNPMNLGAEVPRHFLSVLSPGDPKPFERGSGRLELAEAILKEPLAMRVMANRVWKGLFGTGDRRHAEQFRNHGRASDQSGVARISGVGVQPQRNVGEEAAARDAAELGVSALDRERRGELREGRGQSIVLARESQAHGRGADSRFDIVGRRESGRIAGRAVGGVVAGEYASHGVRQSEPL